MPLSIMRCTLRLTLLLLAAGAATAPAAADGPSDEHVADRIDSFISVFITTAASMNPTSDLCDRLAAPADLPIEVRMARAIVAVYKEEPVGSEAFQNFLKAVLAQELEASKLLAREPEFVADMAGIVERLCTPQGLPAIDRREVEYNAQLTPELAARVWEIAAAIEQHTTRDLTEARTRRRAAILAYVEQNPQKVAAIGASAPSEAVAESRRKVRESLEARRPPR